MSREKYNTTLIFLMKFYIFVIGFFDRKLPRHNVQENKTLLPGHGTGFENEEMKNPKRIVRQSF